MSEKGEIRLNTRLQKTIEQRDIEMIFSKNYRILLLNPGGGNCHKFTKAGTVKNRRIVTLLQKAKIEFPAIYIVDWDKDYGMWKGELKIDLKK